MNRNNLELDLISAFTLKELSEVFERFRSKNVYDKLTCNMVLIHSGSAFVLDEFGQISRATLSIDYKPSKFSADRLAFVPVSHITKGSNYSISWSPDVIPDHTCLCPICGVGWTISNMTDPIVVAPNFVTKRTYGRRYSVRPDGELLEYTYSHRACVTLQENAEISKKFIDLIEAAGIDIIDMTPIENQYHKSSTADNWYAITTSIGTVVIGWRKRVISMQWVFLNNSIVDLSNIIKTTNTIGSDYVHAYGYDQLGEFLKVIKLSAGN